MMKHTPLPQLALMSLIGALASTQAQESPGLIPADSFVVPEGFEVSVWATSPMFYNPTNMDIDHQGRVWVAEGRNYRLFKNSETFPGDPKGDRIMVLSDTDGDGKADKSHVFVQEPALIAPLGVAVIDNKVVVSQPPELIVYTDVNRDAVFDPKVDHREVLLTGFGGQNHDHSLHSVTAGPSGQWYFNTGNAGTHVVKGQDGWTLRAGSGYNAGSASVTDPGPNQGGQPGLKSDDGHVYVGAVALRMNPDGTGLRPIGHNMRNSYEETVNSFGDVFQNDNDDPPACRTTWLMEYGNLGFASDDGARKWQSERRPGQAAPIAEWRQEDPGTIPAGDVYGKGSPTGICYYENGSLGEDYRGLLLSGEAARNVVFGYLPVPDGAGFKLERFDFLRSKRPDEFPANEQAKADFAYQFRPSDVTVGPDGAIYVADWFDSSVGAHRMGDKDCAGAIYRITRKKDNPATPKLALDTVAGQIAALKSPANNVRNAGFTRLKSAGEASLPAVKALLSDSNPYIRARAIWLLAQLGDKGIAEVEAVLKSSKDAQTRIACFRALRFVDHKLLDHAKVLAQDPSIAVRREVALALRNLPLAEVQDLILTLAKHYQGEDRWYLEALGTACTNKEAALFSILQKELGHADPLQWSAAFAKLAWRLHPPAAIDAFQARAMTTTVALTDREDALTALGFMPNKRAALAVVAIAENGPDDTRTLAKWWLQNRSEHVWSDFKSLMKGLEKKPNALKYTQDYLVPTDGPTITKPTVPEVLALKGDVERGRGAIARCYMCHQVNGTGIDFGPALDQWGIGQSPEAIATAIIDPSAGIAHGFEAIEILTREGHTIQGFSLSAGPSSLLKVLGGGEVSIPRNQIKTIKPLEHSLMLSAGQLGMQAQEVADVVAFLKEGLNTAKTNAAAPPAAIPTPAAKALPK
jgi:putative membrane-bound dehydrogenase-like protein